MASPIDPQMCLNTGRLMTEWFEYPEYTPEQELEQSHAAAGTTQEELKAYRAGKPLHLYPLTEIERKVITFVQSRRRRTWRNNMTQQEVAMRMNEATKIVSPDNMKFLPDDVRERTGLEINPLWMMEVLVRSSVLSPKEQVQALKELAQYTHSKAPTVNQNTNINVRPEDWLLELAKEEYKVIDEVHTMPVHHQPREKGMGRHYAKDQAKKTAAGAIMITRASNEIAAMEAELEGWDDEDE